MSSSHSAVRKALRGLEDGLSVFTAQLAQETAELRRNVENRPRTGATYYRNILEDLQQRAEGLEQELVALEAVSTEAVSLEELVGHAVALYCQNHAQIQELETQLAQFGYRDLFAPLPPENPLDMLELSGGGVGTGGPAAGAEQPEDEGELDAEVHGSKGTAAEAAYSADSEALGEVTNRLAASHLGGAAGAAGRACDHDSPPAAAQQRWGPAGCGAGVGAAGTAGLPRTTIKAMAPMTAAKALMRADTPSSLASPEAMSPSMRELLGKYAASSSGGTLHQPSTAGLPTATGSAGDRTPQQPGSMSRATPPAPAYLSPAFQLAAMEQEVQMAHAEAAAAMHQGGGGGTPEGAAPAGWHADDAMYSALTATAKKLAGKPSFMEAYRQKFPAVMASTERLLQTVEKQRRPAVAAAVAQEEAAAGPVAALALAVQAAAGHMVEAAGAPVAAASTAAWQQQQQQPDRWRSVEEESTLDLMAQVLHSRQRPASQLSQLSEDRTWDMPGTTAAAAGGSAQLQVGPVSEDAPAAAAAARLAATAAAEPQSPSTAALLSRALSGGSAAAGRAVADSDGSRHLIRPLGADPPLPPGSSACSQGTAAVAGLASVLQSAPSSERSKPQLEEAIAAALGRSSASASSGAAPAPAAAPAAAAAAAAPASVTAVAPALPARSTGAPGSPIASCGATQLPTAAPPPAAPPPAAPEPAPPASQPATGLSLAAMPRVPAPPTQAAPPLRTMACPPPPPSVVPPPGITAATPAAVPPLHPVNEQEFWGLPTFIRSQLPLEALNSTLAAVHAAAQERGSNVFSMEDVQASGPAGAKCKVVVNSLVKLGRVQLQVARGGAQGTLYLLV